MKFYVTQWIGGLLKAASVIQFWRLHGGKILLFTGVVNMRCTTPTGAVKSLQVLLGEMGGIIYSR